MEKLFKLRSQIIQLSNYIIERINVKVRERFKKNLRVIRNF